MQAHNAIFDTKMLLYAMRTLNLSYTPGFSMLCTVKLARQLLPTYEKHSLSFLANNFKVRAGRGGGMHGARTLTQRKLNKSSRG